MAFKTITLATIILSFLPCLTPISPITVGSLFLSHWLSSKAKFLVLVMLLLFLHFSKFLVLNVGGAFSKVPSDSPHELGNNAFAVNLMIFPKEFGAKCARK